MGKAPCCQKVGLKRGRWTSQEDETLIRYIQANGEGSWRSLPKNAGLLRCGKSCRLRWINYLRGDLKRGNFTQEEEEMIVKLHTAFGNRWSMIASHLPGRTDNEIKNHWNSHLSRQIYRFVIGKKDMTQTSIDISTLVNQKKPIVGRVSRRVAKKYNKNRVYNNSKSTPQTSVNNQTNNQNVEDCSIFVTKNIKGSLVCDHVNCTSDDLGWNDFGVQDDELIDINYFLECEAIDSTDIKNSEWSNSKPTPQKTMNNQIDHQNVGDCSIFNIKENLVCDVNATRDELGRNDFGVHDDELIDINYFLECEAMDLTKQIDVENIWNNSKSSPPTTTNNQIDHQNVGDCSISITKNIEENLVYDINGTSDKLGWKYILGVQDDELIDINYFLESEALNSTEQISIENIKNDGYKVDDKGHDQNLKFDFSETKEFGFDERDDIGWDMGFGFNKIDMCDERDDMLVWLWQGDNL